ncbi:hypothetical protein HKD37_07G018882 [Glycine soja]
MKKMTFDATKEITEKIEQALQGSFVPHGRQDVLTAAIERPEHPGHVRVAGVSVTIKQYFGSAPQTSHTSSSMAPIELEDQLEESVTEKVTRQLMASFSQMQSQFQSQMQAQGLALPTEPEVGPLDARVSTKESCVDPSGNDPDTGESNKCGLYIEENPPRLVALGRVYEGSITVHNIPLLHDQVKVGVEEVKDAAAPIPVPTDKGAMGPAKPAYRLNHEPFQIMWDATVFGVFNQDFPLYIKHEDLSEIAYDGQCLSTLHEKLDAEFKMRCLPRSLPEWCNRQKGSTECGYYYFNDVRPLEAERFKAFRIQ